MNKSAKFLIITLLSGLRITGQPLTLEQVYRSAETQYPLIKQRSLLRQSGEFSLQNIAKGALPQLSIAGSATYQSEVPTIPLPNGPVISKDQYRIYAEAVQPLTDLITVRRQQDLQREGNQSATDNLESELYQVRERINGIYFGILLLDEQRAQTTITQQDLQTAINKVSAAVENGTDFRSSLDKLKAESFKIKQRDIELKAARAAYVRMLGQFTGQQLPDTAILETPQPVVAEETINRPELRAFESQQRTFDAQSRLLKTKALPRFSMFIQGGAGRPALNFLDNDLKPYYIGGLRLNWSIGNLYTLKKERAIVDINREISGVRKETFLFNTSLSLQQQRGEVTKIEALIDADREIIALRRSIKTASEAQLQNGVITVNDYLREVLNEESARELFALHNIQLLQAHHNLIHITGN